MFHRYLSQGAVEDLNKRNLKHESKFSKLTLINMCVRMLLALGQHINQIIVNYANFIKMLRIYDLIK